MFTTKTQKRIAALESRLANIDIAALLVALEKVNHRIDAFDEKFARLDYTLSNLSDGVTALSESIRTWVRIAASLEMRLAASSNAIRMRKRLFR
jgi:uncharacterized coiled-coil protein SlyX